MDISMSDLGMARSLSSVTLMDLRKALVFSSREEVEKLLHSLALMQIERMVNRAESINANEREFFRWEQEFHTKPKRVKRYDPYEDE